MLAERLTGDVDYDHPRTVGDYVELLPSREWGMPRPTSAAIVTRRLLFWQERGRNWAVEVTYADAPRFTPSMASAVKDLGLDRLWVLYPGDRRYPLAPRVEALPLAAVGSTWDYGD